MEMGWDPCPWVGLGEIRGSHSQGAHSQRGDRGGPSGVWGSEGSTVTGLWGVGRKWGTVIEWHARGGAAIAAPFPTLQPGLFGQ